MSIVTDIMKMVDHSLLAPNLTDQQLTDGCEIAAKYNTASVCVKPYHVKAAAELLDGTDVLVGGVIGFPHGNSTTAIKLAETEQILSDGAVEVDMVINVGKVLSGDWDYVLAEISAIVEAAHARGAIVKVIFENDLLPEDSDKVQLCDICTQAGADFIKTSTGYNYIKGEDGKYSYQGATLDDLALMIDNTPDSVQVKAAGNSGTLERVLLMKEMGVTRTGTGKTVKLFEDAVEKFE